MTRRCWSQTSGPTQFITGSIEETKTAQQAERDGCVTANSGGSNLYHEGGELNRCVNPFGPESLGGRDFSDRR